MQRKITALLIFASLLFIQCNSLKKQTQTETAKQTARQNTEKPDKDYIPVDPDVRIGKLPNGMTYYIRRNTKPENKVEMRLAVNAGSILEDDDQLGLAHFMEHMNFNGLKHFPKNELVHFLQRMGVRFGADLNAYTGFDQTVYLLPIPLDNPENLDKGLLVIHDWAYFANLDSTEIEKERGVILEEYRLGLGAEKRMWNKSLPILFKNSRYAERLPIGKKEILESFPHEALKRYHSDWYRPDLEAVIIVGDINPDEVEAKLHQMFADIPAKENPRERKYYKVPNHEETLISVADDPEAAQNTIMIYYKDREDYRKDETVDDYKEYLKGRLVTTMFNNRLKDLKEQAEPPFSFAFAQHGLDWAVTKEALMVYAIASPNKRMTALKNLLTEAKKIEKYGFTPSELERAKKELITSIEEAYNNRHTTHSRNYARQYVNHYIKGESIPSVEWEYQMQKQLVPQFTIDEVNTLAKKYIHDDNRVILVHGKRAEDIKPVTQEDVRAVIQQVNIEKLTQPQEEGEELVLMKEKPTPGKIIKTEKDDILGTTTYYLSNGAKVTLKKTDFKEDEILFMAYKFGGKSLLDKETLKKTAFAYMGLTEAGVNGLKKKDLRKILAGKKARLTFSVDDADQFNYGTTLNKDFETAMQLNYLYFTALNKDKTAFDSWKKRMGAYFGNMLNSPMVKFQKAFFDYLHQNDPRYVGIFPTPEALEQSDYDLAYKKFREFFDGATGFNFYIVGNYNEKQAEEFIKSYIGGLPESTLPAKYKDHGFHLLKGHHNFTFHAGKAPKSLVIITFYDETPFNPEEKIKLEVFANILTNKLIDNIREKESGVYTIRAQSSMEKIPHSKFSFLITFPCGPKNAERLAGMAEKELNKLITQGFSTDDMQKVIKSMIVKFDEDKKTNRYWLEYLSDTDYLEIDPHRIERYKSFLQSLTPEDIRKTGEKYLKNPKNKVRGILYPEEKTNNQEEK